MQQDDFSHNVHTVEASQHAMYASKNAIVTLSAHQPLTFFKDK